MIAEATYYTTDDGTLCKEGDERAAFLVCRKGTEITGAAAAVLARAKAIEAAPENKAISWPSENKRMRVYKPRKR